MLPVVDDDEEVRVALRRLVSSAGFAVKTFASGAEFLHSVDDREPDCVVPDLHTPEACARALRLGATAYLRLRLHVCRADSHSWIHWLWFIPIK